MNYQKKLIFFMGIIFIFSILISGCNFVTSDYESYTVSYIKVSPTFAYMKVSTSKTFKVYAYDSEDNIIPVDSSKVSWELAFQCPDCLNVGVISPENGSITTSFTPYRTGLYHIYAYYEGKKDNSPIQVNP
jgi:hypothetical protein